MVTAEHRSAACPEPEELARYLDGQATAEERAAIQRHLADCDDCREAVADTVRYGEAERQGKLLLFVKQRKVQAIGGGVLALAASLILVVQVRPELNPFRRPTPYEELVAAAAGNRTIEGRLTRFAHGQLRSPARSAAAGENTDYQLLAAAARIRALASDQPSGENFRALGVAQVALGQYDEAIAVLQRAAESPDAARSNSDLSAAFLARGRLNGNPEDYAKGLAAAERAIRLDPTLPEAYFNRALALDYLNLKEAAGKAWDEAAQHDSSGWAEEARSRARRESNSSAVSRDEFIQALRNGSWDQVRPVFENDAQFPREIIEDELVADWARAVIQARPASAAAQLDVIRAATAISIETHPDALLKATVDYIDSSHADSPRLLKLAAAHLEYSRGRIALRRDEDATAAHSFARASKGLLQSGSPFRLWADFHQALVAYYQRDLDRSAALCKTLEAAATLRGYAALLGRVQWLQGLLSITAGRYGEALTLYHSALSAFERHGDREHRAAMGYLLAEVHMNLGDRRAAWTRLAEALASRDDIRDPWRRQMLLAMGGVLANRSGLPHAALAFQATVIDDATARGNPAAQTEAYLSRAITLANLGASGDAQADIAAAHTVSQSISDPRVRQAFTTDVLAAEGEMRLALGDPAALRPLDIVIPELRRERHESRLARLMLARARAHLLNGREHEAEADLQEGIALVERLRSGLEFGHTRLRYTDRVWDLYEQMAALSIRQDRPEQALTYVDRARARLMIDRLDQTGARTAVAVDVEELRRIVPADAVVLSYLVVDAVVGVWVVTPAVSRWVTLPGSSKELRADVETYVRALANEDDSTVRRLAETLYARLLAPLSQDAAGIRRLIVVPHDVLSDLPFATLYDRSAGEYVVQRHAVLVIPSLLGYRLLSERGLEREPVDSVLAVGDPALTGGTLPRLAHASVEAEQVARLYPRGTVLTGSDATRARVMENLVHHNVFHFAGHAVASTDSPELSRLLLASSSQDPLAAVYAHDLWSLSLRQVQLVVLSACRTADGPTFRGEGAVTLSSAFLAAGVPRVIGALWDVPDDASAHISRIFHQEYASGSDHDVALRAAQLSLLKHHADALRRPAVWGAFQAFGVTKS